MCIDSTVNPHVNREYTSTKDMNKQLKEWMGQRLYNIMESRSSRECVCVGALYSRPISCHWTNK